MSETGDRIEQFGYAIHSIALGCPDPGGIKPFLARGRRDTFLCVLAGSATRSRSHVSPWPMKLYATCPCSVRSRRNALGGALAQRAEAALEGRPDRPRSKVYPRGGAIPGAPAKSPPPKMPQPVAAPAGWGGALRQPWPRDPRGYRHSAFARVMFDRLAGNASHFEDADAQASPLLEQDRRDSKLPQPASAQSRMLAFRRRPHWKCFRRLHRRARSPTRMWGVHRPPKTMNEPASQVSADGFQTGTWANECTSQNQRGRGCAAIVDDAAEESPQFMLSGEPLASCSRRGR